MNGVLVSRMKLDIDRHREDHVEIQREDDLLLTKEQGF